MNISTMNPTIFIASQLNKLYTSESLVKVGVNTAFIKDQNQNYSFGGKIYYEDKDVIVFHGLPKRIEIEGDNLAACLEYEHNDLLGICYNLKQKEGTLFYKDYFLYDGEIYYSIHDLEKFR